MVTSSASSIVSSSIEMVTSVSSLSKYLIESALLRSTRLPRNCTFSLNSVRLSKSLCLSSINAWISVDLPAPLAPATIVRFPNAKLCSSKHLKFFNVRYDNIYYLFNLFDIYLICSDNILYEELYNLEGLLSQSLFDFLISESSESLLSTFTIPFIINRIMTVLSD